MVLNFRNYVGLLSHDPKADARFFSSLRVEGAYSHLEAKYELVCGTFEDG